MSSRDVRRAALGLTVAALLPLLGACGTAAADPGAAGSTTSAAHTAVPADDLTGRLAAVEFARQCAVTGQSFADESAITTDLDDRLTAAGLTHAQWKSWHDALAGSPQLTAQWTQVSAPGCPAS